MSTEWETRVKEIYSAALQLPAAERARFVQQECGDDAELHARLESLLHKTDPSGAETVPLPPGDARIQGQTMQMPGLNGCAAEALPRSFGAFELLNKIGAGGMGVVYAAKQRSPERIVALKVLRPDYLGSDLTPARRERLLKQFQEEIKAAARVKHANLLTVFEAGCHDGRDYFTMSYVEGRSLADALKKGRLAVRRSVELMEMIARAVQAANVAGVLHGDLTPRNILLDRDEQPFVADFGLATFVTDHDETKIGTPVGTRGYCSPQQARGERWSTASDQFSLGVILYQLLTGQMPFPAASFLEYCRVVQEIEPIPPRGHDPALPRDLEAICLKCLQKDPQHRYQSCAEFADDLARWRRFDPVKAHAVSAPKRLYLWTKRKPWQATLSACLILTVIVGVTGVIWQWRRAEEQRRVANETVTLALARINKTNDEIANSRWLDAPGTRPLRLQMLAEARAFCEELQQHRQDDPAIRMEIARAWGLLGSLTQDADPGELALQPLHRAETIYAELLSENPNSLRYRAGMALTWNDLGRAYRYTKDLARSRDYFSRSIGLFEQVIGEHGANTPAELRYQYAHALNGSTTGTLDPDMAPAERTRRRNLAQRLGEAAIAERPDQITWIGALAHLYSSLGVDQTGAEQFDDARETYARYQKLLDGVPLQDRSRVRIQEIIGMYENGMLLLCVREFERGKVAAKLDEAHKHMVKALRIRQQLVRENIDASVFLAELAVTELNAGRLAAAQGRPADAVDFFELARQDILKWKAKNPNNPAHDRTIALADLRLGRQYCNLEQYEKAFPLFEACFGLHAALPAAQRHEAGSELAVELARCADRLENPADRRRCAEMLKELDAPPR